MAEATKTQIIKEAERLRLLTAAQIAELKNAAPSAKNGKSLAAKMVRRGWLTIFQAKLLLNNRGDELLLGSYVLIEKLGEGGMGAVFKARNRNLGRICAVKRILKDRLASDVAVRRFYREMRAAAQLDHPNVVRAYDADTVNGVHFIAMEYVDGVDLAKLVKDYGPPPVKLSCEYIRQAALGLQHAHERGLVHRDIKPANLLLVRADGQVTIKILDMGLARQEAAANDHSGTITQVGMVMGTPDYMAPEQSIASHSVDIRADLYSLGCTFYFLLTGTVPFPGGTLTEKLIQHQIEQPKPIDQIRPDVPAEVIQLVAKLMAKDRDERHDSPGELAAELETIINASEIWESNPAAQAPQPGSDEQAEPSSDFQTDPFWVGVVAKKENQADDKESKINSKAILAFAVAAVAVIVLVGWVVRMAFRSDTPAETDKQNKLAKSPPIKSKEKRMRPAPAKAPFNEFVAKEHQKSWATYLQRPVRFTNSIGMNFVLIPPGSFQMGTGLGEIAMLMRGKLGKFRLGEIMAWHRPRRVRMTRPFYLGEIEVTQEQWGNVLQKNAESPELAADYVSWEQADKFCRLLSDLPAEKKAGRRYRLPTEAEWEYACRAGTTTAFAFGDQIKGEHAAVRPLGRLKPGSFQPNGWGLYDMHGSQLEWCADWFAAYDKRLLVYNPIGPSFSPMNHRVLRGGSSAHKAPAAMSARRRGGAVDAAKKEFGVRVVCEIDEGWIDLLAGVDVAIHGDKGLNPKPDDKWRHTKNGVRSPALQWSRIKLPVQVGHDYHIKVNFTPKQSQYGNQLLLLLPASGKSFAVRLKDPTVAVLHKGVISKDDDLVEAGCPKLQTDQRYELDVTVTRQGPDLQIELQLDGKPLATWTGSTDQLHVATWAQLTRDHIYLMPWQTVIDIHSVQMRRLQAR